MSFYELNKIMGKAATALHDSEKFPVGILAVRARKVSETFPSDPTVVAMCNFLTKRASSEPLISRAELRSVYHKLYSQNNHFGSIFSEELGIAQLPKAKIMHREASEGKNLTQEAYTNLADPTLSNALSEVFDPKGVYRPYSVDLAKSAARTCLHELTRFVPPKKIDVVAGQADLLICQAAYETPKGWCNVLVPIEVKKGTALLPTVFLNKIGFVDLTKENLESHILETSGKNFSVNVEKLLEVVALAKNGGKRSLSNMEMIIAKAKAAKGDAHTSGILYQEVDSPQLAVETPRLPEADEFATRLANTSGIAEFKFGKTIVDVGRSILRQSLKEFGYTHANIAVANVDESTIYFAASVDNKVAFKIPMKIVGKDIQYPQLIISAGNIYEFSKSGIDGILSTEDVDTKMLAAASPAYGLKSSELVEQVYSSMNEGNLLKAEDALAVLQQSEDVASFKEAFAIYQAGLGNKIKTASQKSCCAKQRKVAYSKYVICGHTNLPTHKVYQDQNGDCQPLYRKDIGEAEGGSFLHSKVYFG